MTLVATHVCISKAHAAPFCCIPRGAPSTCLDRLSCSPLKPAKDWLRMMPLGPPGENDWDPTSMISGSLVGSPVDRGKLMVSVRLVDIQRGNKEILVMTCFSDCPKKILIYLDQNKHKHRIAAT